MLSINNSPIIYGIPELRKFSKSVKKKNSRSQIPKKIVYTSDVDKDISNLQKLGAKWETDLHPNQKVYLLVLRTTILPQLLLLTKKKKEETNRAAINC
jgi:hypothetical protein